MKTTHGIPLPQSTTTSEQVRSETVTGFDLSDYGYSRKGRFTVKLRYDDKCNNGHNTFSITAEMYCCNGKGICYGCQHDEVKRQFPQFEKYIKWHLVSSDGLMYYIENSQYHAKGGNLAAARQCAVWPDATVEDILDTHKMLDRLPALMEEFKADMVELGFTY